MIDPSMVTSAIVAMGVEATWERAKRQMAVIKLLKRFKLDPANPPTDFDGIYMYTLIEYGVDRPEPILNFFRNKFVREAFQQSFYKDDPSILDKEAEDIIQWNEETGKLGHIDYDPRREFAAFSAVFHAIVDRARTPAEVKRDQKLETISDDLHQATGEIIERLGELAALNDVRAERARLVQSTLLDNLAQQMGDWFKTLNYSFEKHEERTDHYFEWIINVPARRGYDRILVRGIEGAAEVSDVAALRKAVDKHRTNEGWLVTVRRVEQSTRNVVKKWQNRDLFCYTFDELLDEHANFDRYFNWLQEEVKRRGIDRMYVPLACTKEDIDPVTKKKIGESHYNAKNGWIEGYIDRWLDDPSKEHISVLGEFGTGKTWFTLHYAWVSLQRYLDAKTRGVQRPRLPLVIPLRDYAKAVSIESLFSEFFFRKHEIPLSGYSAFEQLNRMGKLLLIFDGFDEMADRVDRQKMINNFWELARVAVPGAKVILTCRTEHFPDAKEGRALLSAELQASIANLTGEPPQFEVLEVEHFNDDQIRQVLSNRTSPDVVKQVMSNQELLELARRPIMTELILEALPDIKAGKSIDLSRVYLYAVRRKMERDIKDERTFTSLADKLYFLCELSWEMLSTNQMSLNYKLFPDRLRRLFGPAVQEQKDLDHWHYDMMGQTLLIRNADGDYTPAHRSLLEFFVAYKFAAELGILSTDFTEVSQTQAYLDRNMSSQDYTWSSYFQRTMDERGNVKLIPPLGRFIAEPMNCLITTVGKEPLTPAILDLMQNMINHNDEGVDAQLIALIMDTRGKIPEEVGLAGGNVASILIRHNPMALNGLNLSGVNISHADLSRADLSKCNLDSSDLSHSTLVSTTLVDATLRESRLNDILVTGGISSFGGRILSVGALHFYYADRPHYEGVPTLDAKINVGEIIVASFDENVNLRWQHKIESLYIFGWYFEKESVHILTIEGEIVYLDLQTGQLIIYQCVSPVLRWFHADLANAKGLSERNTHLLKILGAINVPGAPYDPRNDQALLRLNEQVPSPRGKRSQSNKRKSKANGGKTSS